MNIVIPILDKNKDKYKTFLTQLGEIEGIKVFVGIEENSAESMKVFDQYDNIFISTYQNGSTAEGMINALQKYVGIGATIVLRKPISIEELNKFMNCKRDVATCKVERSRIKDFFFSMWQTMLKFILGIREYKGDTSAVYISEEISAVVNESGNLSYATRANRWKGIEQSTVLVSGEPVKKEIDKKAITKYSAGAVAAIVVALAITLSLCLTINISIIIGLLIICLDMICLAVAVLTIIIVVFNCRVGSKKVEYAYESIFDINDDGEEDDEEDADEEIVEQDSEEENNEE